MGEGKIRFDCPSCGKAIRVSETSKKARCPGCKQVIDVAAALAGKDEPAGGAVEKPAAAEAEVREEAAEEPRDTGGEPAEGAPDQRRSARRVTRTLRRASRAMEAAPRGFQAWMATAAAAVAVMVALMFLSHWIVAIVVAVALWVYVDSSLLGITRVVPKSPGYAHAPMVWSLIGFVPLIGVGLYLYLRKRLIETSREDYADPDMSLEEMESLGKMDAPEPLSPNMILVVVVSVLLVFVWWKAASTRVDVIDPVKGRAEPTGWYNGGKLTVRFVSSPIEGVTELSYVLFNIAGEKDVEVVSGVMPVEPRNVADEDASLEARATLDVTTPGRYRVDVRRGKSTLDSAEFNIRQ